MAGEVFAAACDANALEALRGHSRLEETDSSGRNPLMVACRAGLLSHVQHMMHGWDECLVGDVWVDTAAGANVQL
jgi:hypothetical protein